MLGGKGGYSHYFRNQESMATKERQSWAWAKRTSRSKWDPAIPLLGIYPEKTTIQKDTCTLMFTAALFTIARSWKQRKCSSTDKWIKKMWYIYTMEY